VDTFDLKSTDGIKKKGKPFEFKKLNIQTRKQLSAIFRGPRKDALVTQETEPLKSHLKT